MRQGDYKPTVAIRRSAKRATTSPVQACCHVPQCMATAADQNKMQRGWSGDPEWIIALQSTASKSNPPLKPTCKRTSHCFACSMSIISSVGKFFFVEEKQPDLSWWISAFHGAALLESCMHCPLESICSMSILHFEAPPCYCTPKHERVVCYWILRAGGNYKHSFQALISHTLSIWDILKITKNIGVHVHHSYSISVTCLCDTLVQW